MSGLEVRVWLPSSKIYLISVGACVVVVKPTTTAQTRSAPRLPRLPSRCPPASWLTSLSTTPQTPTSPRSPRRLHPSGRQCRPSHQPLSSCRRQCCRRGAAFAADPMAAASTASASRTHIIALDVASLTRRTRAVACVAGAEYTITIRRQTLRLPYTDHSHALSRRQSSSCFRPHPSSRLASFGFRR